MPLILLKFLKKNSEISNRFGVVRSFDPKILFLVKYSKNRITHYHWTINFYKLLFPKKAKNDRNE